jgi:hypothetical protein
MDWLGDFLAFCLHHGFGGLALLLISGWAVLMVVLGVLLAATRLGQAFAHGWGEASRD